MDRTCPSSRSSHGLVFSDFITDKYMSHVKSPNLIPSQAPGSPIAPYPQREGSPNTTSDPVTGLQASVPKHFQIFINLGDLCRWVKV